MLGLGGRFFMGEVPMYPQHPTPCPTLSPWSVKDLAVVEAIGLALEPLPPEPHAVSFFFVALNTGLKNVLDSSVKRNKRLLFKSRTSGGRLDRAGYPLGHCIESNDGTVSARWTARISRPRMSARYMTKLVSEVACKSVFCGQVGSLDYSFSPPCDYPGKGLYEMHA